MSHVETVWLGWRKYRADAHAATEACMTWLGVNGFLPPNVKTIIKPDTSYPDGGYHIWLSISEAIYPKLHDLLAEQMPARR